MVQVHNPTKLEDVHLVAKYHVGQEDLLNKKFRDQETHSETFFLGLCLIFDFLDNSLFRVFTVQNRPYSILHREPQLGALAVQQHLNRHSRRTPLCWLCIILCCHVKKIILLFLLTFSY